MDAPSASSPSGRPQQPWRALLLREALARAPAEAGGGHTLALANALIEDAVRENASDIHLDPLGDAYQVRFRVEGALVDLLRLPAAEGLSLVRAFKSQAELEPAFALRPLEGRADWPAAAGQVSV